MLVDHGSVGCLRIAVGRVLADHGSVGCLRIRVGRVLRGSRSIGCSVITVGRVLGMTHACATCVAVRDFKDLVAWQLAYELKCEVFAFTAIGPASKDFKYRDQVRDSSASAPRNIAEGFGRFRPREFVRYLEFARASLIETQNHLLDGRDRGYLDVALYSRLSGLARSAVRVTTSLLRSKNEQVQQEPASRHNQPAAAARHRRRTH